MSDGATQRPNPWDNPRYEEAMKQEIALDLKLSDGDRSIFWSVFRIGLLHGGMPQVGKVKFALKHEYSAYPEFKTISDGTRYVCINPWKFADRVAQEFLSDENLITASDSFPLANIVFNLPDELP